MSTISFILYGKGLLSKTDFKETIKLAWPVSLGQLGHVTLGVVDSVMVGQVGTDSLAASSLVNGLFFLVIVLGIGMTMATTPLVSIAKGENNFSRCSKIFKQSIIVNFAFSVLLTFIVYYLSFLIPFLNQSEHVAVLAESYLKILSYSIIPFLLFQTYRQYVEGLSITKPPMYIAIAANIINFFGNWLLIYGNLGFSAMGLDGAGYSTLFTRLFMAITIIIYVKKAKKLKQFSTVKNFISFDLKIIKKIIAIGLPSGLMYALEVGAFAFSAIMVGWLGSIQLAAHQIAISLASISYMIILGISAAGTIRVGNALGERNKTKIRRAGFTAIIIGVIFMILSGTSFIIFNKFFPSLYIENIKVIEVASNLLIIAALFQISDGIQAIGLGILRGLTDVKVPLVITFIAYWVFAIPFGYILGFKLRFGVIGIWSALLIGLTIAAVLFFVRFNKKTKQIIFVNND